ncbi:helix-turn-helix domain-containing protein [Actinomycetota bacterium]
MSVVGLPDQDASTEGEEDEVEPLLYTTDEAARVVGIGRSKLYELMAAGKIESVHIGRSRRIPAEALADFVAALRQESSGGSGA